MVISWKLFWATLGAVAVFALGGLVGVLGVPPWLSIPATVAVALCLSRLPTTIVHGAEMFRGLKFSARETVVNRIRAAVAVHAVWLVAFELRPDLWVVWAVVGMAVSALTYWVARLCEYLLKQVKPPRRIEPAAGSVEGRPLDDTEKVFKKALNRQDYGWLLVQGWKPVGGDPAKGTAPFGVQFQVQVPSKQRQLEEQLGNGPKSKTGVLTIDDAEPIAIGISEEYGQPIATDWVGIDKTRHAGRYNITVVTEDVMGRVYPFEDDLRWTTIADPALVGYQLDGTPYYLPLAQHGQDVGQSTYGKSSLINVKFAHITRCRDGILWVGGVEKLYDLVAGWVEPYMDTDLPLPIDWIANGQSDALAMLVAQMNIARWRQRQPMTLRGGWPTLIVQLDEASFVLKDRTVKAYYQGKSVVAADMAATIMKGSASGDSVLHAASQHDTNGNWGDDGADVNANMGYSAGFRSRDRDSLGRLMGNYKLPVPMHRGEFWLNPGNGEPPVHLKAPYIQSVDPTKPRLHGGLTIADVAWSRRDFQRSLDSGSAEAAGPAYAKRHTRMNAEMLQYLTGVQSLEPAQIASPEKSGYELAMAELDALIPPTGDSEAGPAMSKFAEQRTHAERVVAVVVSAGGPMGKPEIAAALEASGQEIKPQVLTNTLGQVVADGKLVRADRGMYAAPESDAA